MDLLSARAPLVVAAWPGGVGHLESESGTVSTRRSVRPYVAAAAMAVAGGVLVLGSLVVTLAGQRWVWEPEVTGPEASWTFTPPADGVVVTAIRRRLRRA